MTPPPPCELCNDTGYVKSNTLEIEGPCPNGCDAHYIAGYRQGIEDAVGFIRAMRPGFKCPEAEDYDDWSLADVADEVQRALSPPQEKS